MLKQLLDRNSFLSRIFLRELIISFGMIGCNSNGT